MSYPWQNQSIPGMNQDTTPTTGFQPNNFGNPQTSAPPPQQQPGFNPPNAYHGHNISTFNPQQGIKMNLLLFYESCCKISFSIF